MSDFCIGLLFAGLAGGGVLLHWLENEVNERVVILGRHEEERGNAAGRCPKGFRCGDVTGPVPRLWGEESGGGREEQGAEVVGGADEG